MRRPLPLPRRPRRRACLPRGTARLQGRRLRRAPTASYRDTGESLQAEKAVRAHDAGDPLVHRARVRRSEYLRTAGGKESPVQLSAALEDFSKADLKSTRYRN